jgi:hypothetical protein
LQEKVRALLLLPFRAFQPIGALVPHDLRDLAPGVKLADAVGIMLDTILVGGSLGKTRARRNETATDQDKLARSSDHGDHHAACRAVCRD